MLTTATAINALPRPRHPARLLRDGLVTVARFAGHFAVACVSVAVIGVDTEH